MSRAGWLDAVRRELWLLSDSAYKNAALGHRHQETARAQRTEDPEEADSFTPHEPTIAVDATVELTLDREAVEALAKAVSGELATFEQLQQGEVSISATRTTRRFASTEGDLGLVQSESAG